MTYQALRIAIDIYQFACALISFYFIYVIFDLSSIDMIIIMAILLAISLAFFISGIGLVRRRRWGYRLAAWVFVVQIPMITSNLASYLFNSLLALYLKITVSNGFLVGFDFKLRTSIDFFIGSSNMKGFVFGVNLFALAAAWLLFRMLKAERRIEAESSGAQF